MKKLFIFLVLLILFSLFVLWNNNSPKAIISRLIKNNELRIGELNYRIYFLGLIPVGEAVFSIDKIEEYKGSEVYHLTAQAKNLPMFSKLCSASAVIDSYVDIYSLNPVLFKQELSISGKEDAYKEAIYDQKEGIISIAGVKRQILSNTQDPLSAILNIRKMDFDKISEFEMNINTNQKNYLLKGTVRPNNVKINNKIYKTFVLRTNISRRDKNPYHKSNITMVLLKDKENIPILIKVFASGILINAKLTDIK